MYECMTRYAFATSLALFFTILSGIVRVSTAVLPLFIHI